MGKVPYAAASENELAEASFSDATRLGTDASLAGDHSSVSTSSTSEATNRPQTVFTNGRVSRTRPRPTSQPTMTRRRSQRSTSTPPTEARKNPGIIRALMTRAMAASGDPFPTRAVRVRMANRPIQSPMDDTTWASQRRKNDVDPSSLGPVGSLRPLSTVGSRSVASPSGVSETRSATTSA